MSDRFELRSHWDATHSLEDSRPQAAAADEFVKLSPGGGLDGAAGRVMFL